jgi:hypothetical protein
MNKHRFGALASLSSIIWPVLLLRPERSEPRNPLWNVEFAAACCDKWLRAQGPNPDPALMILYHTTCMMLHVDILLLQQFVALSRSTKPRSSISPFDGLNTWAQSEDHQIALWHARGVFHHTASIRDRAIPPFGLFLRARSDPLAGPSTGLPSLDTEERPSQGQSQAIAVAPHLPYAVYFATIVLCASAALKPDPFHEFIAHLARGKHVLAQSRVRIARLLSRVLDGACPDAPEELGTVGLGRIINSASRVRNTN